MVINKTAWHFRWLKFCRFISVYSWQAYDVVNKEYVTRYDVRAPQSVCPYFWLLMLSFVATLATVGFALTALAVVLWIVAAIIVAALLHPATMFVIFSALALLGGSVVVMIYGYRLMRKFEVAQRTAEVIKKPKQPSIVWAFVKAKKSKVCPLIEFK